MTSPKLPRAREAVPSRALTTALLLALLPGAPARAVEAEPPAPGVALRFAWPAGLQGKRVERRQGRAPDEVARRAALRIERRGAETWLLARPAEVDEGQAAADRQDEPDLPVVVDAAGRFLRLDGLDAWAEEQSAFQVKLAASKAEAEAALRAAREAAARIEAEARELWSWQVAAWMGRTVEIGRSLEASARTPIDAVPGLEVEQRVTLGARRWTSCSPGGIDRRCLELTLRAEAGPDAFRKGLAAAGGKAAKGFEDGSILVEVVLVTDPETLVPWRLSLTRRVRLVFAGRGLSVDQVERREREYQWWKG